MSKVILDLGYYSVFGTNLIMYGETNKHATSVRLWRMKMLAVRDERFLTKGEGAGLEERLIG